MRNFLLLTMTLILLAGCSAPFRITDRPTYGAIDQIKNKYQPQDKIKLVIDQKTKELRLTKGPSDLVGAATAYDFNIGEAFSGHLTELFNSVFINTTNSPLTVNVKIDSCNLYHFQGYSARRHVTLKDIQRWFYQKANCQHTLFYPPLVKFIASAE